VPGDPLEERVRSFIELGAGIAGSLAGSAAGFLLAGPPGAFVGAAGGQVLKHTLKELAGEFFSRTLGRREKERIGGVLIYAAEKVREKLDHGEKIRDDDFFTEDTSGRDAASEVTEGVILAAQREHEEKKLRFYGNLIANLAFTSQIDRPHANLLVRAAQRLSYRQLCLLALAGFMELSNNVLPLRQGNYRNDPGAIGPLASPVLFELYDLYQQGLVHCGKAALLSIPDIVPANIRLQGPGANLFNLMELKWLWGDCVNPLVALLS
jgi:hypothetical protein